MGLFLKNQQPDLQCITNYVIVNQVQHDGGRMTGDAELNSA